jgi:ABC-2 type transport system ATP-binding protein
LAPILTLENVFGGYFIHKPVLKNISFSVNEGEMIGLIGLNGAGKSTTIKHILGLLQPQQGDIRVKGQTLAEAPEIYRSAFAYVPESPELYEELTIWEHLELTALAYGLSKTELNTRADKLLDLFHMRNKVKHFPAYLSKGMRQKVMIMNAFLIEPPLYIIDEPFLGLDPLGIRSLLDLMVTFKEAGASFLISSHILSTLEKYCDRFLVLNEGVIVGEGTLVELGQLANMEGAPLDDIFYKLIQNGGKGDV